MVGIKLIVSQNADTSSFNEHSRFYTSEISVVDINDNNRKYKTFSGTKKEKKIKSLNDRKRSHTD